MRKILIFGPIAAIILFAGLTALKGRETVLEPSKTNYEADLQAAAATTTVIAATSTETAPVPPPSIELAPGNEINQGGTLRVIVKNFSGGSPNLIFQDKNYFFFNYGDDWNALIPIGVEATTGPATLTIGSSTENVVIKPGDFNVVKITLPKLVTSPEDTAKYQAERKNILAIYNSSAPNIYFDKPFGLPLDDVKITNEFGQTYLEPDNTKTFHNGVDLKAAVGTPIKAINDGVVKLASEYILEGKFVMIDHGFGVFSDYLHLSKIMVSAGDKIVKGQVIGLAGDTGEAVGPHLHFIVKINNVPVDPLAFIKLWQ